MLSILIFGVIPVAVLALVIVWTTRGSHFFWDFTGGLYDAGRSILHGHDPYRDAFLAKLATLKRAGGSPSPVYSVPVYPAPTLLAAVPLALLPARLAGLIFTFGSIAAMVGGLRLLGVRDWRCYGAALLCWPSVQAVRLGALEPWLLLGLAALWRWRDRPPVAGVVGAVVAAAKLFLWPVGVWLLATRRFRAVVIGIVAAVLGTLAGWAVIGFAGMSEYPTMLGNVSTLERGDGISLTAVGVDLGISPGVAQDLSILLGLGVLALAWVLGRRPGQAHRGFGLAVLAALVASPVVWPHYLTLIFIPIALISPALGPLWLVPLLAYVAPYALSQGELWRIVPYLIIELTVVVALSAPLLRTAGISVSGGAWKRQAPERRLLD